MLVPEQPDRPKMEVRAAAALKEGGYKSRAEKEKEGEEMKSSLPVLFGLWFCF